MIPLKGYNCLAGSHRIFPECQNVTPIDTLRRSFLCKLMKNYKMKEHERRHVYPIRVSTSFSKKNTIG